MGNYKRFRPELPKELKGHVKSLRKIDPSKIKKFIEQETEPRNKQVFKLLVFSDLHGVLVDRKAFDCMLSVISDNQFDEIVDNGDTLDLPYLSRHVKKLNPDHKVLLNYSEIDEIEFVKRELYKPLREVSGNAKIIHRDGNHDERITNPSSFNKDQLERLYDLHSKYDSTKIETMLDLKNVGIEYDGTKERNYFNIFSIVHGLSLAKNAPVKNIYEYFSSGTSGHTHRLSLRHIKTKRGLMSWAESGCMRLLDSVEYLPTGKIADWAQGFVTATFDLSEESPKLFLKNHPINNGICEFNGKIYSYKDFD